MPECGKGETPVCYCRKSNGKKKERRKLTKEEKKAIEKRMAQLEPLLFTKKRPPLIGRMGALKESPHYLIDTRTVNLTIAMFRMPLFFAGGLSRMLDLRYRKRFPDPHERYEVIKKLFKARYGIKRMPPVYEFVVMQACLYVGGKPS